MRIQFLFSAYFLGMLMKMPCQSYIQILAWDSLQMRLLFLIRQPITGAAASTGILNEDASFL